MTFEEFLRAMTKELYVWRMANHNLNQRMLRSRETRLTRVRRRIDDAVLARALTVADERRCASVAGEPSTGDTVRCEFPRGHAPAQGRRNTVTGLVMHDKEWDHAAPSRGVWWMEPEEAHA